MRRRIEVSGTCTAIHAPGCQLAGPPHQQFGVLGHPLQRRIADQDVGVGLRCPVAHVTDTRVDAAFPGGVDHLR